MSLARRGDNTYANFQEASRTFWRQTVLPLVNRTLRAFSAWLAPAFGGRLELKPDLDQIEALSSEREALWARLEKASFLTQNEKRASTVLLRGFSCCWSGCGGGAPAIGVNAVKQAHD